MKHAGPASFMKESESTQRPSSSLDRKGNEAQRGKGLSHQLQQTEPRPGPCSLTALQAGPSAPPPCPPLLPVSQEGLLSPGLSFGGAAWPQLPTPLPPMELGCFGPSQHLRSISGCVLRRQAPPSRQGRLPSATSAHNHPPSPAVSEPLLHQDRPARPAPHLHGQAQLQPPENTDGALSLVDTARGCGNGTRDAVWGEFNKSSLKNVLSFPQGPRALLSQPDPTLMPNSLPRWGSEDRPPSFLLRALSFDRICRVPSATQLAWFWPRSAPRPAHLLPPHRPWFRHSRRCILSSMFSHLPASAAYPRNTVAYSHCLV